MTRVNGSALSTTTETNSRSSFNTTSSDASDQGYLSDQGVSRDSVIYSPLVTMSDFEALLPIGVHLLDNGIAEKRMMTESIVWERSSSEDDPELILLARAKLQEVYNIIYDIVDLIARVEVSGVDMLDHKLPSRYVADMDNDSSVSCTIETMPRVFPHVGSVESTNGELRSSTDLSKQPIVPSASTPEQENQPIRTDAMGGMETTGIIIGDIVSDMLVRVESINGAENQSKRYEENQGTSIPEYAAITVEREYDAVEIEPAEGVVEHDIKEFDALVGDNSNLSDLLDRCQQYAKFLVNRMKDNEKSKSGRLMKTPLLLSKGKPRPHQLHGIKWLCTLYDVGINGILADEMGLGKTLQIIGLICKLYELGSKGPFLIISPLSGLSHWLFEFSKFAPNIPVMSVHGNVVERTNQKWSFSMDWNLLLSHIKHGNGDGQAERKVCPVVITTYEVFTRDRSFFLSYRWKLLVADEGHRLKNSTSAISQAIRSVRTTNRFLVTGTPLQNNLKELWSLLNFLMPEIFTDEVLFSAILPELLKANGQKANIHASGKRSYLRRLYGPDMRHYENCLNSNCSLNESKISMIHAVLSPFMLRRVKCNITDAHLKLPTKVVKEIKIPMAPMQLELQWRVIHGSLAATGEERPVMDEQSFANNIPKKTVSIEHPVTERLSSGDKENTVATGRLSIRDSCSASQGPVIRQARNKTFHSPYCLRSRGNVVTRASSIDKKSALPISHLWIFLRKLTSHPKLLQMDHKLKSLKVDIADDQMIEVSGKFKALSVLLPRLVRDDHRVLIFVWLLDAMDLLEDLMDKLGLKYCRIDGSMVAAARSEQMRRFSGQDADYPVFLLSGRAGGIAINLSCADTVILFDSDWNPMVDEQAQDRCHRIGQVRDVLVLKLISTPSIDQYIAEKADMKRWMERLIVGPVKGGLNSLHNLANDTEQGETSTRRLQGLNELVGLKNASLKVSTEGDQENWMSNEEKIANILAR